MKSRSRLAGSNRPFAAEPEHFKPIHAVSESAHGPERLKPVRSARAQLGQRVQWESVRRRRFSRRWRSWFPQPPTASSGVRRTPGNRPCSRQRNAPRRGPPLTFMAHVVAKAEALALPNEPEGRRPVAGVRHQSTFGICASEAGWQPPPRRSGAPAGCVLFTRSNNSLLEARISGKQA